MFSSPAVTTSGLAYMGDHAGRVHVFDIDPGGTLLFDVDFCQLTIIDCARTGDLTCDWV